MAAMRHRLVGSFIPGKRYNARIWKMLGGSRKMLPAYASTYQGDENGGLDGPAAFAEFAVQCQQIGAKSSRFTARYLF